MIDPIIDNFNHALDEMIEEINRKMEERDRIVEENLKDQPALLLRYKNAIFKLDCWIKSHPFQVPPDGSFFMK